MHSRLGEAVRLFVIMGVSGSGKTTVGKALAPLLGGVFMDGDGLHSPENIAKMARGEPLTDADRLPWLMRVGHELAKRDGVSIIGCSALKRAYRDAIRSAAGEAVCFILLSGKSELIASRLGDRKGHFMPASLLASQLATLEPLQPDESSITVDIGPPPAEIAFEIERRLRQLGMVKERLPG